MLFTPLRKALIGGAAIFAVGVAAGVGVHSATASNPTLTASPSTTTPAPSPGAGKTCEPRGHDRAFGAARQVLSIAASVLGQTQQQILDQLRTGKTLDQIAGDKASTIEQQSLAKLKTELDKRVSSGKLSSSQESSMLDKAKTALEKAMSSDLSKSIPSGSGPAADCDRGGLLGTLVKVTAQQTGMTVQQVMDALKSGKSIDQIAGDKAAAIKAAVLQELQQRDASALDNLMGRTGLQAGGGPGHGHGFGGKQGQATPSPST